MIPLVDDYIQYYLVKRLKFLKENPEMIDQMFKTGRRETLDKLKTFVSSSKFKVIIGYPRETSTLPCYVITLAPEQEQPLGLGDNSLTFDNYELGMSETDYTDDVEEVMRDYIAATYMNATYRIECWSDNGDLTSYMYIILKWALWSCRLDMLRDGWVNITLSGTDLEPVPDYMPVFIYRRAAQLAVTYENKYYENVDDLGKYIDVVRHPEDYHKDDEGNIRDNENNVIIIAVSTYKIIINAHYYSQSIGDDEKTGDEYLVIQSVIVGTLVELVNTGEIESEQCGLQVTYLSSLPETGESGKLYLLLTMLGKYKAYSVVVWNSDDNKYENIKIKNEDLYNYSHIYVVKYTGEETPQEYTFTLSEESIEELGSGIFNS